MTMKRTEMAFSGAVASFLLALCCGSPIAAEAAEYPWPAVFRNVAVSNAARYRTDWRINEADWATAEKLCTGVEYLPVKLTAEGGWKRLTYCHFVRIDLRTPNLRFTGTDRAPGWNEEKMLVDSTYLKYTVLERTGDFIARFRGDRALGGKNRNMILAWNSTAWSPFTGGANDLWGDINGPFYADGVQVSKKAFGQADSYWVGMLVIWKDCTADFIEELRPEDVDRVWICQPGFVVKLVTKGAKDDLPKNLSGLTDVRPRTSMGLSKDKHYVYVVVVDGDGTNDGWSAGCDLYELRDIQLLAGVYEGFNCDGGGSTAIAAWDDAANRPLLLGRPAGGWTATGQRADGANLGVYLAPELADEDGNDLTVRLRKWYRADREDGTTEGGRWTVEETTDKTFVADEKRERQLVRNMSDVVFDGPMSEANLSSLAARLSDGSAGGCVVLGYDTDAQESVWRGLIRKNGAVVFEKLYGDGEPAEGVRYFIAQEIDTSGAQAKVRYYAGEFAGGSAVLLHDGDGRTEFDAASVGTTVNGEVEVCGAATVRVIEGTCTRSGNGTCLILR